MVSIPDLNQEKMFPKGGANESAEFNTVEGPMYTFICGTTAKITIPLRYAHDWSQHKSIYAYSLSLTREPGLLQSKMMMGDIRDQRI